jgi:uncharacterized protein Yka (UPF0111/DUF47 family)
MVSAQPFARGDTERVAKLDIIRRTIEEKFTSAAELLSQTIEGIECLIESLDKLGEAFNASSLAATVDDLSGAAFKLASLPDKLSSRAADLQQIGECRKAFAGHVSDMCCNLAYMRAFTDNIGPAADSLGEEGGNIRQLAVEISGCIRTGGDELKELDVELSSLQHDLDAAQTLEDNLNFQIDQLLPMVPENLMTSGKTLDQQYRRISETAVAVSIIARDIHRRISAILGALQIGDLTRQRVEHIQSGVITLDIGDVTLPLGENQRISVYGYALLSAQLSAAAGEFYREVSDMERSLTGLAADARELLRLHDLAYGGGDGKKTDLFFKLCQQIASAQELVGEVEYTEQSAVCTGRNAAETVHGLSARIAALHALKDSVMKLALEHSGDHAHSGEAGRVMALITDELRKYAELTETSAAEVIEISRRMEQASEKLTNGENNGDTVSRALGLAADRIRNVREHTETDIPSLVARGDALINSLERAVGQLGLQTGIGEILDQLSMEMAALGEGVVICPDDIAEALCNMLNKIQRCYSMAQERELHRSVLKEWGIVSGRIKQLEEIRGGIDDVLF